MKILVLHPNFPGQFRSRLPEWVRDGYDVRFLCQTHYGRAVKGVNRICLKGTLGHDNLTAQNLSGHEASQFMAKQFYAAMLKMREAGWAPDIVISHTGWGCGLYTPLVYPESKRIGYIEWWFDCKIQNTTTSLYLRNATIAAELSECHVIVAPTDWQRSQLPQSFKARCHVIPDGVDVNWFKPNEALKPNAPLVTYGTRGMEATRGFPQFIMSMKKLLAQRSDVTIEIAGEDKICYGGSAPEGFKSFGTWAQAELSFWSGRVSFVGTLAAQNYREWLQRSWVHVYLTTPYVASWSLLESMACGCCIIASDTGPVRELTQSDGATLVAGWDAEDLPIADLVGEMLTDHGRRRRLSERARTLAMGLGLESAHRAWRRVLDEALDQQG